MLQAMYNGVSAILGTQQNMDVIGNNIANVNTDGFKSSSVSFADQLSSTIQGATAATATQGGENAQQVGLGVKIGSIDLNMSQGGLNATNTPTDMAISGNGFFQVASSTTGVNYTRDGHFALDNTGTLVQADSGEPVLGWAATTGGVIDQSQTIDTTSKLAIPIGSLTSAKATNTVSYQGNLSADAAAGSAYSRNVKVFDSQGDSHTLTVNFTRGSDAATPPNATNTWNYTVTGDPGLAAAAGTTNQGSVVFDTNGNFVSQTGTVVLNPINPAGQNQDIRLDMSPVKQLTGDSTVASASQDGFQTGTLQSFTVDGNGIINGLFSNGLTQPLGQLALANFANTAGLTKTGSNGFAASPSSGEPLVSAANSSGLGAISTSYLENSNVDLGTEFTNMIVAQRSYQANTKIVTTVDQMLDELINMKQ